MVFLVSLIILILLFRHIEKNKEDDEPSEFQCPFQNNDDDETNNNDDDCLYTGE